MSVSFTIAVVSANRALGHAIIKVFDALLSEVSIRLFTDYKDSDIPKHHVLLVDTTAPFKIIDGVIGAHVVHKTLENAVRKTGSANEIVEFHACAHGAACGFIYALAQCATAVNGDRVFTRRQPMPNRDDYVIKELFPVWHELANDKALVDELRETRLVQLRDVGLESEAEEYERRFSADPNTAMLYARQQMNASSREDVGASSLMTPLVSASHGSQSRSSMIHLLLVDDNPQWRESLDICIAEFNAKQQEFVFKLHFVTTPDTALYALRSIKGLQAVILDYALAPGRDPSYSFAKELALKFRAERPELPIFGLTGQSPEPRNDGSWESVAMEWAVDRVFYKGDPAEINELMLDIVKSLRLRSSTPFFSALCDYAREPKAVFHALPLSRAKSVAGSSWCRYFLEFYREGYFAAETSTTMPPLDSLFSPSGTLKEARRCAAQAFCSDDTLFVTNGTTGANCIVYQALAHPGDLVLLDRNCHKSHHYAAMQSGCSVVYMEPDHLNDYGISGRVSLDTILASVHKCGKSLKLLTLTHPTFDGLLYDPEEIMRRVLEINPNVTFFFDEAWFAYGAFHPMFRRWSSTCAAQRLRAEGVTARVYVTQSIHKTLSAMRQGSMIHICDSARTREDKIAMEEAFIAHTTTSPNYHILASLDVARMQAVMEGYDRLTKARQIAAWIRHELRPGKLANIEALTWENLIPGASSDLSSALDPLKITVNFRGATGLEFRNYLFERDVHINKYSHNTVLVLVTIGTTWSMAHTLLQVLQRWSATRKCNTEKTSIRIPEFNAFGEQYVKGIQDVQAGDIRTAYHAALKPNGTKLLSIDSVRESISRGEVLLSATFVSPYPPGYPILVPGQIIDAHTQAYIEELLRIGIPVGDIHGLTPEKELPVLS